MFECIGSISTALLVIGWFVFTNFCQNAEINHLTEMSSSEKDDNAKRDFDASL
jgi:hypothetical protein